jgi:hypothetical protein
MTIKYIPFPAEIRGVVFGMIYGSGNIAIDSSQPEETQQRALRHELAHLVLGHQDTDKPIKAIEAEADALAATKTVEQLFNLVEGRAIHDS